MKSFWYSRLLALLQLMGRLLGRFDGRDALLAAALGCLTAGVWLYSAGAALIVLGLLLLVGWVLPVLAVWARR